MIPAIIRNNSVSVLIFITPLNRKRRVTNTRPNIKFPVNTKYIFQKVPLCVAVKGVTPSAQMNFYRGLVVPTALLFILLMWKFVTDSSYF